MIRILIVLFALKVFYAKGQINLVPNWSFEIFNQCPNNWDQLYKVNNWIKCGAGTPDYWNAYDTSYVAGVPNNQAGYQFASSGTAYIGADFYSLTGGNTNSYREFFGTQLISSLIPGTTYYITLKVSSTIRDTSDTQFQYASNNQCVLFTTLPYSQANPLPILNFAQLVNSAIITDTAGWTTLRWSFVADSSYQFIVIGNFFNDSLTAGTLINPTGGVPFAYYYIDDVCVSTDSMYCETLSGMDEVRWQSGVRVYPNPCFYELTVELRNMPDSEILASIYDLNGRLILNKKMQFINQRSYIDLCSLNAGMYLLFLQSKNKSKKLVFIKN